MTAGHALTPTPKVTAASVGGAAALLLVWIGGLLGIDVPPEAAAALAFLLATAAGYLRRDRTSPPTLDVPRG